MRVLPVARGQGAGSTLQNEIGEADWRKPRHLALAPPALVPPGEATPARGVTSRASGASLCAHLFAKLANQAVLCTPDDTSVTMSFARVDWDNLIRPHAAAVGRPCGVQAQ